jgi:hypothetical protein
MRRYYTLPGVILGIVAGSIAGFFLGSGVREPHSGRQGDRRTIVRENSPFTLEGSDRAETKPQLGNWLKSYQTAAESAADGQPTQGITEAIADTFKEDPPADGARLLMLIEFMRKEDFPLALELMLKAKTRTCRGATSEALWSVFWRRFGELDPATALARANECVDLDYPNRKYLEKNLFMGMVRNDPGAAAAAYLAHPDMAHGSMAMEGLMVEWARKDFASAFSWAQQNLQGGTFDQACYMTAWAVSTGTDISKANGLMKSLAEGTPRNEVARSIKSQIRQKPELPAVQAFDYVSALRELGTRDRSFEKEMARRFTASDPMAAANYFVQPLADGSPNDYQELRLVVSGWVQADPNAAQNWAKGFVNTPQYEVISEAFSSVASGQGDSREEQVLLDSVETKVRAAER